MRREKANHLDSRPYSPPSRSVESLTIKLLAPWRSLTYVYPRSSHGLVPSNVAGSLEATWLWGDSDQPQYVRYNKYLGSLGKMMYKSSAYRKHPSLGYHCSFQTNTSSQNNSRHSPRNGQAHRWPVQPPGPNIRVCLGFVFKTFIYQKLLHVAYWINVVVLKFTSSVGQKFQRGGW